MTAQDRRADQLLDELERLHDPDADPELEALKAAILLEDGLGVLLDDEDIVRLREGPSAVPGVLARRRGPR